MEQHKNYFISVDLTRLPGADRITKSAYFIHRGALTGIVVFHGSVDGDFASESEAELAAVTKARDWIDTHSAQSGYPKRVDLTEEDDAALMVGRIIAAWTEIDQWFYFALPQLQMQEWTRGCMEPATPTPRNNKEQREKLRRFAVAHSDDPAWHSRTDKLLKRLESVGKTRHLLAHGSWWVEPDAGGNFSVVIDDSREREDKFSALEKPFEKMQATGRNRRWRAALEKSHLIRIPFASLATYPTEISALQKDLDVYFRDIPRPPPDLHG